MNSSPQLRPLTLGLFQKRIAGDDCLLELARLRFQQAGLGAEMHAETFEELEWLMTFRPSAETPVVVHLPRDFAVTEERSRKCILDLAAQFAGRVYGFVVHDQIEMNTRPDDFVRAARDMESRLARIEQCPMVFIEYAAGLEPGVFAQFFESIRELTRISACLDTGHVGIWQARAAYACTHPGEDICALKSDRSKLPQVITDVQNATNSALPEVLKLIEALGQLGKPVHFHLHDGHPLSRFSPFGVSDHLSFLMEMPIEFPYDSRRTLPLMYGPAGLSRIVGKASEAIGCDRVSFTLEIHPTADRLPLGDAAPLFGHWRDKTNAEQMNHWLSVLHQNHRLLLEALQAHTSPAKSGSDLLR